MDGDQKKEKPFDTVSIVFVMLVAAISDISDLFTGLIAGVPYIGQAIYLMNSLLVSPFTWVIIQGWFIMKVGLTGRKGLLTGMSNLLGGLGNTANIPGSETITTAIAIIVANHEELAVGAALVATTVATGGAAAPVAASRIGATATRAGATAARAGTAAAKTGVAAGEGVAGAEQAGVRGTEKAAEGVERTPIEKMEDIMEKIPEPEERHRKEEEENEEETPATETRGNEADEEGYMQKAA